MSSTGLFCSALRIFLCYWELQVCHGTSKMGVHGRASVVFTWLSAVWGHFGVLEGIFKLFWKICTCFREFKSFNKTFQLGFKSI